MQTKRLNHPYSCVCVRVRMENTCISLCIHAQNAACLHSNCHIKVTSTTILHITEIDKKKLCSSEPPSVSRRVIFHLLICPICGHVWEHPWFSRKDVENEEGDEVLTSTMSKIS